MGEVSGGPLREALCDFISEDFSGDTREFRSYGCVIARAGTLRCAPLRASAHLSATVAQVRQVVC